MFERLKNRPLRMRQLRADVAYWEAEGQEAQRMAVKYFNKYQDVKRAWQACQSRVQALEDQLKAAESREHRDADHIWQLECTVEEQGRRITQLMQELNNTAQRAV